MIGIELPEIYLDHRDASAGTPPKETPPFVELPLSLQFAFKDLVD